MSSYTTSDVSVAPAVELLSAQTRREISEGLSMAGTAAAGAGTLAVAAGAVSVAAVVLGTGWILYTGGRLAYKEMDRIKKETEEKAERERLLEEHRIQAAKTERLQIHSKCKELKNTWENSLEAVGIERDQEPIVKKLYAEIEEIEHNILKGNAKEMEYANLRDLDYLTLAGEKMEKFMKDFLHSIENKEKRQEMIAALEKLHHLMQKISLDKNASGHDVQGRSVEKERLRKCKKRTEELIVNLRYAIGKEAARQLHMPVKQEDQAYLHLLFDGADQKIETLMSMQISIDQKEYLLNDFEKRLNQYESKKIQLDQQEERFTCLYPVYFEVAKKLGEIPKNISEFGSLQELEATMEYMKKRVERMEQCAEIYRQMGKEAYICMAFDIEMEKLGYKIAERKYAQKYVYGQLYNGKVDQKTIPYYSMPDHSLTQFYHFGKDTGVQVIVREDGTTSLETFAISENRENVVKEQKEHCRLNKELSKALSKNWFICSDLSELIPPEHVTEKSPKEEADPSYGAETIDWQGGLTDESSGKYQVIDE